MHKMKFIKKPQVNKQQTELKIIVSYFYHWLWKKSLKELISVNTGKYMKTKNYTVDSVLKFQKWHGRGGENNIFKCIWERRRCWGGEKNLYVDFASATQCLESTHRGRRKGGDFKNHFPTKKPSNLELHAWVFKAATSFPFTVS